MVIKRKGICILVLCQIPLKHIKSHKSADLKYNFLSIKIHLYKTFYVYYDKEMLIFLFTYTQYYFYSIFCEQILHASHNSLMDNHFIIHRHFIIRKDNLNPHFNFFRKSKHYFLYNDISINYFRTMRSNTIYC